MSALAKEQVIPARMFLVQCIDRIVKRFWWSRRVSILLAIDRMFSRLRQNRNEDNTSLYFQQRPKGGYFSLTLDLKSRKLVNAVRTET